jgi:hypothetical protein
MYAIDGLSSTRARATLEDIEQLQKGDSQIVRARD